RLNEEELRAAARAIDAVAHKTSIGGELEPRAAGDLMERPSVPAGDPRTGLKVSVPKLRAEAESVEILGGGQLRVAAGSLKLSTTVSEVRSARGAPGPRARPGAGRG